MSAEEGGEVLPHEKALIIAITPRASWEHALLTNPQAKRSNEGAFISGDIRSAMSESRAGSSNLLPLGALLS